MERRRGNINTKNNITVCNTVRLILLIVFACFILSCSRAKKDETLKIGDRAPDFTVRDLGGSEITLSDYAGSPVILRFFLTDCKFCRADTPIFNDYYNRYKSQGVKIIYLDSLDTDYNVLSAFKQELQIPFPIALDIGGRVSRHYKVKALPQTIILDPQHKIVSAVLGGVSQEELNSSLSQFIHAE